MPEKSATRGLAEPTLAAVVDARNGRDVQATMSSLESMWDALGLGDERLGIVRVASYTDSDEAPRRGTARRGTEVGVSKENVELVRAVIEAFNSDDRARTLALIGADFEGEVSASYSAEPDTYRGHDGVLRYFESFHDVMSEIHFHAEQLWAAGESVVVDLRLTAKGRTTEIPVEQRVAQVWTVRGGKARAARTYDSLSEALAAAGLSG